MTRRDARAIAEIIGAAALFNVLLFGAVLLCGALMGGTP